MKLFVFLIFAGCAVKCDESGNYYVIERLSDSPVRELRPFQVYWNVPTFQCKSKKIPFDDLFDKYGIIQNQNDAFQGEQIVILYDPGLFPAILKEESSGTLRTRNGGVPQEGNLDEHLTAFRYVLDQSIPDPEFSGIGIIDFESWRPVFRQNSWGVLTPYRNLSLLIERRRHPWWPNSMIEKEAKYRFERAGREFMQATVALARLLRPKAKWGYYGFPYCFNMAGTKPVETCPSIVQKENDQISWLWSESTAIYPSVYSSKNLDSAQLAALIRGRVAESARVGRGIPILPYFWFKYRDAGFMSEVDLKAALKAMYKSHTSGFILWGSSNDVNTVTKCEKLRSYLDQILGPEIAKYTRQTFKIDESYNTSNNTNTTSVSTQNPIHSMNDERDENVYNVVTGNEETNHYISESQSHHNEIASTKDSGKITYDKNILVDIVLSLIENIQRKYNNEALKSTIKKIVKDRKKGIPIHDTFIKNSDNDSYLTTKSPFSDVKKKGSLFTVLYPSKSTTELNKLTPVTENNLSTNYNLKSTTVDMFYDEDDTFKETTEFNKKSSTVGDIKNTGANLKYTTVEMYDFDNSTTNFNTNTFSDQDFNYTSTVSYIEDVTTAPTFFDNEFNYTTSREPIVTTPSFEIYDTTVPIYFENKVNYTVSSISIIESETTIPTYFDNEVSYTASAVSTTVNKYEMPNTTETSKTVNIESTAESYTPETDIKGSSTNKVLSTNDAATTEDTEIDADTVYDDRDYQVVITLE